MKTKLKLISLAVFAMLFFGFNAKAQENTGSSTTNDNVYSARVDIINSKITSQSENEIKISFEIRNGDGISTNVKYGVDLLDKNSAVANKKIYDETLTLLSGEKIEREVSYSAPEYLNGKYTIILFVKDENGANLNFGNVGDVSLSGSNKSLEINTDSCYLIVEGDTKPEKHYTLNQGVDILSSEKLIAECNILNNFESDITFSPKFETYRRSVYGENVSDKQESQEQSFSVKSGENKIFSFVVPKVSIPQAYDTVMVLSDGQKDISNEVIFHYVISGSSSNILDITIDKDFYRKGESAKVSFFLTGSADYFPDSRLGGGKLENVKYELSILNSKSGKCIEPISSNFKAGKIELFPEVIEDCLNPMIEVAVKDANGNILGKSEMKIESKSILDQNGKSKLKGISSENVKKILIIFAILLPIALLIVFVIRKFKKRQIPPYLGMFIIFGFVILFGVLGTNKAQAFSAPSLSSPANNAEITGTVNFSWSRPEAGGSTLMYKLDISRNGTVVWTQDNISSESIGVNTISLNEGGLYSWKVTAKKGHYVDLCTYGGDCSDYGCAPVGSCTDYTWVNGGDYGDYLGCPYQACGDYGCFTAYYRCTMGSSELVIDETATSGTRNFIKYGSTTSTGATSLYNCVQDCDNGDSYTWFIASNPLGGYVFNTLGSFQIYATVVRIGCVNGGGWFGAYYRLETQDGRPIPGFSPSFYEYQSIDGYATINIPGTVPPGNYKVAFKLHGHYDLDGYRYFYKDFTVVSSLTTLTVVKAGTGSGTVTSSPAGINCGPTCSASSASYPVSSPVKLTATPPSGVISGLAGGFELCDRSDGPNTCEINMSQSKTVTATFNSCVSDLQCGELAPTCSTETCGQTLNYSSYCYDSAGCVPAPVCNKICTTSRTKTCDPCPTDKNWKEVAP